MQQTSQCVMMFEPVDSSHHHSNPQFFDWSLNHMHELRPRAHTSAKGPPTNGRPWPVRKDLASNKRHGKGLIWMPSLPICENQLAKDFSRDQLNIATSPLIKCFFLFVTFHFRNQANWAGCVNTTPNHQPPTNFRRTPQAAGPSSAIWTL